MITTRVEFSTHNLILIQTLITSTMTLQKPLHNTPLLPHLPLQSSYILSLTLSIPDPPQQFTIALPRHPNKMWWITVSEEDAEFTVMFTVLHIDAVAVRDAHFSHWAGWDFAFVLVGGLWGAGGWLDEVWIAVEGRNGHLEGCFGVNLG